MRGHGDADGCREPVETVAAYREPAPGIEQVAGVVADISEFKAGNRAVVGSFELAFVFEGERHRGVFGQTIGQGHADGGILSDTLGRKWLVVVIENAGDAQIIV